MKKLVMVLIIFGNGFNYIRNMFDDIFFTLC